jgi:uncharacterized protein with NRDE domain
MCLIVVGWRVHPEFPLIVAANRDEFYARPTAFADYWPESPEVIGGRDLEAGGTWLGITRSGRFAAVTNVREPGVAKGLHSRGKLTQAFLAGRESAAEFVKQLNVGDYSGFNLLLGDAQSLWYCSNRSARPRELGQGIHGLSNHLLDSPWPKLLTARQGFARAIAKLPDRAALFDVLADDEIVPDGELPNTGVPLEWERLLSAIFVRSREYGTRASTVLSLSSDGRIAFEERSFGPEGRALQSSVISTAV